MLKYQIDPIEYFTVQLLLKVSNKFTFVYFDVCLNVTKLTISFGLTDKVK